MAVQKRVKREVEHTEREELEIAIDCLKESQTSMISALDYDLTRLGLAKRRQYDDLGFAIGMLQSKLEQLQ